MTDRQPWHCEQIPNGETPVIVCQRETLETALAEQRRAYSALAQKYTDAGRRHRAEILHYRRALDAAVDDLGTIDPAGMFNPLHYLAATADPKNRT